MAFSQALLRRRMAGQDEDPEARRRRLQAESQAATGVAIQDIQRRSADDLARAQSMPIFQPPPIQPMASPQQENGLGATLGMLTGSVANRLLAPRVTEDEDGELVRKASSAVSGLGTAFSKLGHFFGFARGGTWSQLMAALDKGSALVGEDGPEIIDKRRGVIPLARQFPVAPLTQEGGSSPILPDASVVRLQPSLSSPAPSPSPVMARLQPSPQQDVPPVRIQPSRPPNEFVAPSAMSIVPLQDRRAHIGSAVQPSAQPNRASVPVPLDTSDLASRLQLSSQVSGKESPDGTPPVQPLSRTLQNPTLDSAVVPLADRQDIIFGKASDASPAASQPVVPVTPAQDASAQRRAELEGQLAKLLQLENTKSVDKDGRIKTGLKMALRAGLQGLAGGGLGGGLGAALGGFVGGVAHPAWNEELGQAAEILKQRGKLSQALQIEKELSSLDAMQTRTNANAQKNSPESQAAKSQKDLMTELAQRMRLAGGRLDPADTRAVELAQQLGIHGKQGGGGFNPQRVRTLRGADGVDRPIYVDGPGDFHYLDADGTLGASLGERDKKFLALELEKENRQRALDGLGPLKWDDTPASSTQSAPLSNAQSGPVAQQPLTRGNPVLTPSGDKPYPVQPVFRHDDRSLHRGGYSRGASGGNQRDQGFAESGAADALAKASEARSRGDERSASAWENKARIENQRLQRAGGTPVVLSSQPNVFQGFPGIAAVQAGSDKVSGRVSRSNFVEKNPQYRGKPKRVIDAAIRGDGFEPY